MDRGVESDRRCEGGGGGRDDLDGTNQMFAILDVARVYE